MSEENQKKLFIDLFETFLHKDSNKKDKIPVSNKVLRQELKKAYESLEENKPISAQSISDIVLVREDPAIWDNGLDSQYKVFLAKDRKPTLASTACCLLSILWLWSLSFLIFYVKNLQNVSVN